MSTPVRESATDAVPLLEVAGLDVSYGPLQVLFGVDLVLPAGPAAALLGTNGAGKSTLLRAIAGLVEPSAGSIRFKGTELVGRSPRHRVELGLTLVEGGRAIFPSLTVAENLRIGAYPLLARGDVVEARTEDALTLFPALRPRMDTPAGALSGGEQQMIAVARAVMAQPELLLVDELSLGLAPVVMQEIVRVVEEMARRGTTVLLVEQSLNVALALAEHAWFMEKGEVRFSGPAAELVDRGDLVRSVFFGSREGAGAVLR